MGSKVAATGTLNSRKPPEIVVLQRSMRDLAVLLVWSCVLGAAMLQIGDGTNAGFAHLHPLKLFSEAA